MEQHGDGALAGAGRAGRDASGGGRLRVLPRQCLLPYPLRIWAEVVARVWAAAVLGCSVLGGGGVLLVSGRENGSGRCGCGAWCARTLAGYPDGGGGLLRHSIDSLLDSAIGWTI